MLYIQLLEVKWVTFNNDSDNDKLKLIVTMCIFACKGNVVEIAQSCVIIMKYNYVTMETEKKTWTLGSNVVAFIATNLMTSYTQIVMSSKRSIIITGFHSNESLWMSVVEINKDNKMGVPINRLKCAGGLIKLVYHVIKLEN